MSQPNQIQEAIADTLIQAVETPPTRRASPRVSLKAEVGLASDTNFFSGFSTDVASGGLFVATLNMVPVGTLVALRFTLPSGTEIHAHGEVRWIRTLNDATPEQLCGMGIQFTEINPRALAAIGEFVAQREPMFFPD